MDTKANTAPPRSATPAASEGDIGGGVWDDPTAAQCFTSIEDRPDISQSGWVGSECGACDVPAIVSAGASREEARGIMCTARRVLCAVRLSRSIATARRDDDSSWEKTREHLVRSLPPPRPDVDPTSLRANAIAGCNTREHITEVLAIARSDPRVRLVVSRRRSL